VDGDHGAANVHSDLELIDRLLAREGTVILHDVSLDRRVTDWGIEVRLGIHRFRRRHPEYIVSFEGNLGSLKRGAART
jgi:hypothetical protein